MYYQECTYAHAEIRIFFLLSTVQSTIKKTTSFPNKIIFTPDIVLQEIQHLWKWL